MIDGNWITFLRELESVRAVAPKLSPVGLTRSEDGEPILEGHFSVFNKWYEIDSFWEGNFLERLAPGTFKATFNAWRDANDDHRISVLLEHGFDPTVGDKPLGVASELSEDSIGARYEVPLFDASYVRDLIPAFEAGAYGSSFRFRVIQDEWNEEPGVSEHNPRGIPERTIKEVRVFEFGPTVFPANPAATAGVRSQTDEFYEQLKARNSEKVESLLARHSEIRTPDRPAVQDTGSEEGAATPETDPPSGNRHAPIHIREKEAEWKVKTKETLS